MALHGTIKDFALPDIFQLIGIQRKTGVLTLENGEDSVTIKFLEGQVVGADTQTKSLEDRLGELLVRTGGITPDQLKEALRVQKNTLQRLGYILVQAGHISKDDLVDALRVQSCQVIYRLFRWRDGSYHFDSVSDLEYDQKYFVPISSETILMEGARMIDEWPIIERRVRSDSLVLRRNEATRNLDLTALPLVEDELSFDLDLGFDRDAAPDDGKSEKPAAPVKLSPEEREILRVVDGKRTVAEICDLQRMGEFDCYRILAELLTRHLIEEVPRSRVNDVTQKASVGGRVLAWLALAAIGLVAAFAVATLPANPITPWRILAREPMTERLHHYNSLSQLEMIERAVQVFYFDAGQLPERLDLLAAGGYLRPEDLTDPWGRPYDFQVSPGGYTLMGLTAEGVQRPGLIVSRRFNATQSRMLLGEQTAPD